MTRLENFINKDQNQLFQTVKSDCSHFLNKYPRLTLYRGYYKKRFTINKFMPRKKREPLHSSPTITKALDKASKKIFGWPCRSQGTFTTPIKSDASFYGKPYIFIPIGSSYKYIYAPGMGDSIELTTDLENIILYSDYASKFSRNLPLIYNFEKFKDFLKSNSIDDKELFKDIKHWYDMMKDENVSDIKLKSMKKYLTEKILGKCAYALVKRKYTNKNLNKVSNEEVIFNCQKEGFYLIDPNVYDPRLP